MERLWKKFAAICVVVFIPSVVCAQGLADTAANEKARRKQSTPTATLRVYTEGDLTGGEATPGDSNPRGAGAGATPNGASASSRATGPSTSAATKGDESSWRQRASTMRANVTSAETNLRQAEQQANGKASMGTRKGTFNPDLANAQNALESARLQLEGAKKGWARLEEDARRNGVPAGWLR